MATKLIRIPSKVPTSVIKEAVERHQKTLREDVNPYLKESNELKSLQNELKKLDANGWETLEDSEQNDVQTLRDAIAYIKKMNESKLNEAKEEKLPLITKGIYTQDGKKVEGARSSKLSLGAVDKHGIVTDLTWKEWVALKVPDTSSAGTKKEFLNRLAKPIKPMAKTIELNTFLKKLPSFEDAVNYIFKLSPNVKYSKTGLKESSNMSNKNYGWATEINTSRGHRFSVGEEMCILVDRGNEYISIYDSKVSGGLTHDDASDTTFVFKTTVEYIDTMGSSVDKDEDPNFAEDEGVEFYFETKLKNTVGKNVKDDTKTTKLTDEELDLIEKLLEEEFTFKKYS